ncbi:MAG: hypothetical protein ACJ8EL_06160 [Rhizomicrobium sp.]
MPKCPMCPRQLPPRKATGRPAIYCSGCCRRAAEYERITARIAAETEPGNYDGLAPLDYDGLEPITDADLAKMKPLLDKLVGLVPLEPLPPLDNSEEETR